MTRVQRRVPVPGFGRLKLRRGRAVAADFGRAWITVSNGRWYASLECERDVAPLPATAVTLGVDRGVHVLAATGEGVLIRNAAVSERRRSATARLQRELETATERDAAGHVTNRRDEKRRRAALRLARASEREANARPDHAQKVARRIVDGADTIAIEALNLRGMTRSAKGAAAKPGTNVAANAAHNRVMLDAGFGLLSKG